MMFARGWRKELLTIPNMLSLFRLSLIPVYIFIYLNATSPRDYFLSGTILAVSCLTDMIDGQIARRFNMITNIGKILDPIADKLTQLALTVCLSVKYPVLHIVLILFLAKEVFQTVALVLMFRRGKVLPGALLPGKLCTIVLFFSFIAMVLLPDLPANVISAIAISDAAFLVYAFIGYYLAYFGRHPKLENLKE